MLILQLPCTVYVYVWLNNVNNEQEKMESQ